MTIAFWANAATDCLTASHLGQNSKVCRWKDSGFTRAALVPFSIGKFESELLTGGAFGTLVCLTVLVSRPASCLPNSCHAHSIVVLSADCLIDLLRPVADGAGGGG